MNEDTTEVIAFLRGSIIIIRGGIKCTIDPCSISIVNRSFFLFLLREISICIHIVLFLIRFDKVGRDGSKFSNMKFVKFRKCIKCIQNTQISSTNMKYPIKYLANE